MTRFQRLIASNPTLYFTAFVILAAFWVMIEMLGVMP